MEGSERRPMRVLETVLWIGVLGVAAIRPWVLGFPPDQVPRIQWVGVAVCLCWCAVKWRCRRRLQPWLMIPCLALALALLLGSFQSRSPRELFLEGHGLVFGLALCASVILADRAQQRRLLIALTVSGTLLAVYAIWQGFVLFPALQAFPWEQLTASGPLRGVPDHTAEYAAHVIQRGRVFGPFPLPGLLAAAIAILLPLSVVALKPWAVTWPRRVLLGVVCGLQALAFSLTQSLGGVVSLCAATLVVLAVQRSAWRWKLAMLFATAVAVGSLLAVRPELSDLSHPRNPIVQRWRYWSSTVRMIRDHPIRGIGAGNYAEVYPRYQHPLATETRFAHNALLQAWVEWGLLGAAGLVGLILASLKGAVGKSPEHQVALVAFWLMAGIDIVWSNPQLACLWWPLIGLSASPNSAPATRGGRAPLTSARRS